MVNLSMFDAIVFKQRPLSLTDLPPKDQRKSHQIYVHQTFESPVHGGPPDVTPPHKFNGLFNMSLSYRREAAIYAPGGRLIKIKQHPEGEKLKQLVTMFGSRNSHLAQKEGNGSFVVQMVSTCKTNSGREDLTRHIQKLVTVDVYGNCGPLNCEPMQDQNCYKMIEKKYKFYLSYENSICKDYITEKYYNLLPYNTIPVVFNGANMSGVAPPHSYISVMDYGSVRDLVEDLKNIAEDDSLFASYFWWRDYYRIQSKSEISEAALCKLCMKLHQTPVKEQLIQDFDLYWRKSAKCRRPEILF